MPGEAPFLTSTGALAYLFDRDEDQRYYLESLKVSRPYLYRQLRRLSFEAAGGENYALRLLVKGLLGRGKSPLGCRVWCAKSFPEETAALGLLALYPSLRIIHIVRNGFDVVQSMSKFEGFSDESLEKHCRRWAGDIEKYRYLSNMTEALVVRHETLLNEPEAFFGGVLRFIGLSDHPGPAEFAKTTLVHPLNEDTKAGVDPRSELSSRARPATTWTNDMRATFVRVCGSGMKELGYELSY
jgi:hypothetical protein